VVTAEVKKKLINVVGGDFRLNQSVLDKHPVLYISCNVVLSLLTLYLLKLLWEWWLYA